MLDCCTPLRYFSKLAFDGLGSSVSILKCYPEWFINGGTGITIGLCDGSVDESILDLNKANLTVQHFADAGSGSIISNRHGTFSATLLVGQGHHLIRGIAPQARLLVADVLGSQGSTEPEAIARALDWLISEPVQLIAIPLGVPVEYPSIIRLIEKATARGIQILGAAGNWYPAPVSFPACHPKVVAVGAADYMGQILPNCSRWPKLDLLAPGKNVAALVGGDRLRSFSGSSAACIVATGVVALQLSAQGSISVKKKTCSAMQ